MSAIAQRFELKDDRLGRRCHPPSMLAVPAHQSLRRRSAYQDPRPASRRRRLGFAFAPQIAKLMQMTSKSELWPFADVSRPAPS